MNGDWDADATSSNTSAQPIAFASCCAIAISPEVDNGYYSGSRNSTGDVNQVLNLVTNSTNWTVDNAPVTIPNTSFTTPTAIHLISLVGENNNNFIFIYGASGLALLLTGALFILRRRKTV